MAVSGSGNTNCNAQSERRRFCGKIARHNGSAKKPHSPRGERKTGLSGCGCFWSLPAVNRGGGGLRLPDRDHSRVSPKTGGGSLALLASARFRLASAIAASAAAAFRLSSLHHHQTNAGQPDVACTQWRARSSAGWAAGALSPLGSPLGGLFGSLPLSPDLLQRLLVPPTSRKAVSKQ